MDILELNYFVALGTILLQGATLALIVLYIMKDERAERRVVAVALPLSFLVSSFAVVMSLVYSEYFGVIPCGLCWLSRAFLYPQAVLFGIASWTKDAKIALYSLALSVIGLLISLYHHYLQMGGDSVLPCPASGAGDCAKRIIFEFGYITFPLIGATTFAFILVLMLFVMRANRRAI